MSDFLGHDKCTATVVYTGAEDRHHDCALAFGHEGAHRCSTCNLLWTGLVLTTYTAT